MGSLTLNLTVQGWVQGREYWPGAALNPYKDVKDCPLALDQAEDRRVRYAIANHDQWYHMLFVDLQKVYIIGITVRGFAQWPW